MLPTPWLLAVLYSVLCLGACALLELVRSAFVRLRYEPLDAQGWARLRSKAPLARLLDDMPRTARVLEGVLMVVPMLWALGLGGILVLTKPLALQGSWGTLNWPVDLIVVLVCWAVYYVAIARWAVAMGMQFPREVLQANAALVRALCTVVGPWLAGLERLSDASLRALGLQPSTQHTWLDTHVQIRAVGDDAFVFSRTTLNIIQNTLRMKDLEAADILLPRDQVKYLDLTASLAHNMKKAREEGYTRYPVCEHDLDHCVGWVHIKDLLLHGKTIKDLRSLQRPMVRVNLRTPVHVVLRRFLQKHIHMGLVYDDFQRFVGLITLEHILEELVGDIQDEFDAEAHYIAVLADGRYRVAGLTPVHDIEATFGVTLDYPGVATFGGLLIAELGRIPEKNQTVHFHHLEVVVDEVSPRRVISALVRVEPGSQTLPEVPPAAPAQPDGPAQG